MWVCEKIDEYKKFIALSVSHHNKQSNKQTKRFHVNYNYTMEGEAL